MNNAWRNIAILGSLVVADVIGAGLLFATVTNASLPTGIYWAIETTSTVGYGDVAPNGTLARAVAIFVMLTAVPMLGVFFTRLTSMHIGKRVEESEERMNARMDARHEELKQHVTDTVVTTAVAATAAATEESHDPGIS